MQKIIFSLLIIFISVNLYAQDEKNFKSFYKTYKKEKSIIGITAPIGIARFFIDKDEKELRNIIKKGKKVRILIFDTVANNFKNEINAYLPTDKYQKFMSVKDKSSTIKLLVKDNSDYITELIFLIQDGNSLVAMGIYGKFSYDDLKEFSSSIQAQAL